MDPDSQVRKALKTVFTVTDTLLDVVPGVGAVKKMWALGKFVARGIIKK